MENQQRSARRKEEEKGGMEYVEATKAAHAMIIGADIDKMSQREQNIDENWQIETSHRETERERERRCGELCIKCAVQLKGEGENLYIFLYVYPKCVAA